jgi:predicted MFS family arabinose efflux permease
VCGGLLVVRSLGGLLALRLVEGAAYGVFLTTGETLVLRQPVAEGAVPMAARYAMITAAGHIAGPALGGLVVAGWSAGAVPWVAGALGVLASLMALAVRRAAVGSAGPEGAAAADDAGGAAGVPPGRLLDLAASTFTFGWVQSALLVVLPPLLVATRGWQPGGATAGVALFALGITLVAVHAVRVAEGWGHTRVVGAAAAAGGMLLMVLLVSPVPGLDPLVVLLLGGALGALSPVCLDALRCRFRGRALLRATGFYNGAYALGLLAGAPVAGVLAARWSLAAAAWGCATVPLGLGFVLLLISFRSPAP